MLRLNNYLFRNPSENKLKYWKEMKAICILTFKLTSVEIEISHRPYFFYSRRRTYAINLTVLRIYVLIQYDNLTTDNSRYWLTLFNWHTQMSFTCPIKHSQSKQITMIFVSKKDSLKRGIKFTKYFKTFSPKPTDTYVHIQNEYIKGEQLSLEILTKGNTFRVLTRDNSKKLTRKWGRGQV